MIVTGSKTKAPSSLQQKNLITNLKPLKPKAKSISIEIFPYMTARLSYWQFAYVFPVTPGLKFVWLYFYSDVYSGFESFKDFFTVKAGSLTLHRNFSASIYTDSLDRKDIYKEFCINVDENQKLILTFIPFTSTSMNYHAFINGIEIVSMPMDLYYRPQDVIKGEEFVPVYVGQPNLIYIDYSMALEMVYDSRGSNTWFIDFFCGFTMLSCSLQPYHQYRLQYFCSTVV